jgi:hypothetical protein
MGRGLVSVGVPHAGGRKRAARLTALAAVLAAAALGTASATAATSSLYRGPGPRPGPALLYAKSFSAPQLQNRRPWRAKPILISGATSYRSGEFLYQDFLYDDNGARSTTDPSDPRAAGNLFSKPNGTYTYPTDARYAGNAADLVELRVKPLRRSTAFRVTLNTLKDPSLVAFSIAIGRAKSALREFPHGANVRTKADYFLTVHPGKKKGLVADIVNAKTGKRLKGRAPRVKLDRKRRQIQVGVRHRQWNPRRRTLRLSGGVGLWDKASGKYLLPQPSADSTHPGGSTASKPAAFFNVAFRTHESTQKPTEGLAVVTDAAWWRDRAQGNALAANDISKLYANVSFGKLVRRKRDDRGVPKRGPMDRILPSHFETTQGTDFSQACLTQAATCLGQYRGRLQPYAIYIPHKKRPRAGWGMTLLMHSLSAQYNQYLGSRNMSQFGERGAGSIVITPEARGPDENYENYGAADVFDVWNDVAHRFRLDPAWAVATGYSLGGIGSFKLGSQFPDLFAKIQPTVGDESNSAVLASLRNVPVLMWNNHGDELVNDAEYTADALKLDQLNYRYELHAHKPCSNPACSPLFPNHLQLAVNDQYAPAAAFLDSSRVNRNPAHVTYVLDAVRNHANLRLVGDHAYWVGGLKLRDPSTNGAGTDPGGLMDVRSLGFGRADPKASTTQIGLGTLHGGNLGDVQFNFQRKTWQPAAKVASADKLVVDATNIGQATIDPKRAHVSCKAAVQITSDGPIKIRLAGCNRTVSGG